MDINLFSPETGDIKLKISTNLLNYIENNSGTVLLDDLITFSNKAEIVVNKSDINENSLNKARLNQLKREFTNTLINYIKEESFEFGYKTKSDLLVEQHIKINALAVKDWLNTIFIDNYSDPEILIGILRLVSRFDINEVSPQGKTMAIAALSHSNMEVKENGIRAFESWGSFESIELLKNVDIHEPWLKEYLESVIQDLKEEYAIIH